MSSNTLLDVDDDSFMNKFILPENRSEYNPDDLTKDFDQKPFIVIHPSPGICVKTKTDTGEKVFLNICTSEKLPAPEEVTETELHHFITSEDSPNFLIPLSIGKERLESDKGGKPCPTYDVVINKSYFEKCQKNKDFRMFTILVTLEAVSNKFNKVLNSQNIVVLKNIKVMGTLQPHRIENRESIKQPRSNKPLIQEISSLNKAESDSKQLSNIGSKPTSNYVILREPREGTPTRLIGLFRMPKHPSMKDLTVLLAPDRVVVSTEKDEFTYDIFLPFDIQDEKASSVLYKDAEVLRLDMPVKSSEKTQS